MFYSDKVQKALEAKRLELKRLDDAQYVLVQRLKEKRKQLESLSAADVKEKLKGIRAPHALPTPEFDFARLDLRLQLSQPWDPNLASMRHWAAQTLENVTTCAVDGSQLPATKDSPLPLAAVQIAWYINSHTVDGAFNKEASVKILSMEELTGEEDASEAGGEVALRRHEEEVIRVRKLLEQFAGAGERTLVFFDGPLAVSYAAGWRSRIRDRYRSAAVSLLRTSAECRVPLIAYTDRSRARDFTGMLCLLYPDLSPNTQISDAALLDDPQGATWESWRSPTFICQRQDVVEESNYTDHETGKSYGNEIYFTYLKINSEPPARLEFPGWLLRECRLDRVIDWVRAEAIVGGGYPNAIQAADAAAVIDLRDRKRYLRALEEFGRKHNIRTMKPSAKQASKERQRA